MLRGVWRKKPMKHSKGRRPMMSGVIKYLATDSHMHAVLLSPPSSRDLSTPRTVPFLDMGAKEGDGGGNKRKRFFEKLVEYLKLDINFYGALVDAEGSGSMATAGPMRQIVRVVVAVSRGMLFIEESRIKAMPRDTSTKKSRSEENRLPVANVDRTSHSFSVQGDKAKNKVLRVKYTVELGRFVTFCCDPDAGCCCFMGGLRTWTYYGLIILGPAHMFRI